MSSRDTRVLSIAGDSSFGHIQAIGRVLRINVTLDIGDTPVEIPYTGPCPLRGYDSLATRMGSRTRDHKKSV